MSGQGQQNFDETAPVGQAQAGDHITPQPMVANTNSNPATDPSSSQGPARPNTRQPNPPQSAPYQHSYSYQHGYSSGPYPYYPPHHPYPYNPQGWNQGPPPQPPPMAVGPPPQQLTPSASPHHPMNRSHMPHQQQPPPQPPQQVPPPQPPPQQPQQPPPLQPQQQQQQQPQQPGPYPPQSAPYQHSYSYQHGYSSGPYPYYPPHHPYPYNPQGWNQGPPPQPPPMAVGPPPQQLAPSASPHHPMNRSHMPHQQQPPPQPPQQVPQPQPPPPQPPQQVPPPQPPPPQQPQQPPPPPQHQSQISHPPNGHTPNRVPPPISAPASPSNVPKVEKKPETFPSFPKNSVEATRPANTKKRKMTSKDVTDIEIWRLLMCLKSGLLAESSWAIDVLSILLNDDSTCMHFNLQNTPGLLEAVLEHFKCCLNELFDGMVSDTTLKPVLVEIKLPEENIPIKMENGIVPTTNKNYTNKTRDGKIVKIKSGLAPIHQEPSYELIFKPVGYSHWQEGNGEDTSHIQVYFDQDNFMESSRRCTCLSTIIRNLSFIPGNDVEMSKHAGLLLVLGRLLLLKHNDVVHNEPDSAQNEWHLLNSLREDTLVIISNISSSLDLSPYNDNINISLLDGLLHWASCSTSYALDPFPAPSMTVSPQRLALESLAKLSIIEGNVDLILATPPWSRIEKLFEVLARLLNINEDQTIREFSLVLLSNLTSADSGIARKVALTGAAIPRLLSFLETSLAEPETTTQDMLRRAAITLKCLSQLVDNHPLFAQHQQRLLNLVMSQKLDQEVVPIIADVIFEVSLSD